MQTLNVSLGDRSYPIHIGTGLLERAGLHVLHESVRHRHSGAGNFVSVTVSLRCENREQ